MARLWQTLTMAMLISGAPLLSRRCFWGFLMLLVGWTLQGDCSAATSSLATSYWCIRSFPMALQRFSPLSDLLLPAHSDQGCHSSFVLRPLSIFSPFLLSFCVPSKLLAPLPSSTLTFTVFGNLHPHRSYFSVTLPSFLLYWSVWLLLALNLGCVLGNGGSCQAGFARHLQFLEAPVLGGRQAWEATWHSSIYSLGNDFLNTSCACRE